MANSAKNPGAGIYGSLAYDFGNPALYPDESSYNRREREIVIPAPPKIDEDAVAAARVKTRQSVPPLAVIGFVCAAVLIVFTLMARIQLTAVTDEAVGLEQQLSELELVQSRLLIDYESAFNLSEIEEYAVSNLGMQRPREEQVFYLNSTVPDKAIIVDEADSSNGLGDRIIAMLSSIAEYFK
ncbi:MAG: cell division protein FtsL [Oscillospiraceae bacterium]